MKKNLLSRTAAVSIAAVTAMTTAVATIATTASADVTLVTTKLGQQEMSGSVILAKWFLGYTTTTYTANITGTPEKSISVSFSNGNASQVNKATANLQYDLINSTNLVSDNSNPGIYYAHTSTANAAITQLKNVATFNSKTALNDRGTAATSGVGAYSTTDVYEAGGTDELAGWKAALQNYVKDYNAYWTATNNFKTADDAWKTRKTNWDALPANAGKDYATVVEKEPTVDSYTWTDFKGVKHNAGVGTPADLTSFNNKYFTLYTYSLESSTTDVKISSLVAAPISYTKASINPNDTVNFGGTDYTLVAGSSNSGTTTTTTTDIWNLAGVGSAYTSPSVYAYQGTNGYWYPTVAAANYYGGGYNGVSQASGFASTTATPYFNAVSGTYSSTSSTYSYLIGTVDTTGNRFYNSATGKYYPTYTQAYNASSTGTITGSTTSSSGSYFNVKTGLYYSSAYDAAYATSSYSNVMVVSSGSMLSGDDSVFTSNYYGYYGYYGYGNSSYDATEPCVYGSTRRSGWNSILSTIRYSSKNSTVKISMKSASALNSKVLDYASACKVNLMIYNANGSKVYIPYNKISSSSSANVAVAYNTMSIPASLVKKAKALNAGTLSTAQITVGTGDSFGFTADVSVKFNSNRAGCTAKIYRYNASRNSLVLAGTTEISSNGTATFSLTKGGEFVVIVK